MRLKLTTSYYLTPNGRKIERRLRETPSEKEGGIVPDQAVDFADKKQRSAVLARLYRRQVPRVYRSQVRALQERFPSVQVSVPLPAGEDVQLAHSLAELRKTLDQTEADK